MSKFFGPDPDSWNHEGASGKVGIQLFGNAVQVWSILNFESGKPSTVAAAAEAFSVDPLMIIEAVEAHDWMFITGPSDYFANMQIEHEGE